MTRWLPPGRGGYRGGDPNRPPGPTPRPPRGKAGVAQRAVPVTTERLRTEDAIRDMHEISAGVRHTVVATMRNATIPPEVRELLMMQCSALRAAETALDLMQQQIDNLSREMGTR